MFIVVFYPSGTDSRLFRRPLSWSQGFSDAGLLQYHTVRRDFLHQIRGSGEILACFHIGDVSPEVLFGRSGEAVHQIFLSGGDGNACVFVVTAEVLSG